MKPASLLLLLCLPACGLQNMYEKEYTFYDPEGKEEQAPEGDATEEKPKADPATTTTPASNTPASNPPEGAAVTAPAVPTAAGNSDLERLFQLEAVLDQLNRAIRDGFDVDGSLASKRIDVELELAWRKREVGDLYGQERQRRIQSLREFETQGSATTQKK